jgi:hypothetical protein
MLRLIVIAILFIGLYWAYYVFAAADPNDRLGSEINSRMPASMKTYGCEQLRQRFGNPAAPAECSGPILAPLPSAPKP